FSHALFLLMGVVAALALAVDARLVRAMLWLLLAELVGVGGFLAVQLAGFVSRGARLFGRLKKLQALAAAEDLDRTLQTFYRRQWRRVAPSGGLPPLGLAPGGPRTLAFPLPVPVPAVH